LVKRWNKSWILVKSQINFVLQQGWCNFVGQSGCCSIIWFPLTNKQKQRIFPLAFGLLQKISCVILTWFIKINFT